MKVICGWCKCYIRGKDDYAGQSVSHGICRSCKKQKGKEQEEFEQKMLQRNVLQPQIQK